MRDIVNGLLLRRDEVLLVRRSDHRPTYPGRWSFPGGHVESGETLVEALVRELGEEIGIVPTDYELLAVLTDPCNQRPARYHMFSITRWAGQPELRGDEHSKMTWLSFAHAMRLPDLALEAYRPIFEACATTAMRRLTPGG